MPTDGAQPIRQIIYEISLNGVSVCVFQNTFAMSDILSPFAFIMLSFRLINSSALFFSIHKLSSVFTSVWPFHNSLTSHFAVHKISLKHCTIFHPKNSLAMFFPMQPLSFIGKVLIVIGVLSLSVPKSRKWLSISNVLFFLFSFVSHSKLYFFLG